MLKAVKFGGSSLADAHQFQKVRDIILADPPRRFVVPSAPGRRHDGDDEHDVIFGEMPRHVQKALRARTFHMLSLRRKPRTPKRAAIL